MKRKAIKIPYAEQGGRLVHIDEVDRGLKCACVCPVCNIEVVAKQGNKTKHHFAHYPGANCSPETVLHQTAKLLLHQRVTYCLSQGSDLHIRWECPHCPDTHEVDLLNSASAIEIEKDMGTCQPDLTLYNSQDFPISVIEIVVTHEPAERALDFYARQKLLLVVFRVRSDQELDAFKWATVLTPDHVEMCLRPRCSECDRPLSRKTLHVVDADCWKCSAPMKVALLDLEGTAEGPGSFCGNDISMAQELGAILMEHYSYSSGGKYVSNTCPSCGAFVGNFYLHDYWELMTDATGHVAGLMCMECNRHFE